MTRIAPFAANSPTSFAAAVKLTGKRESIARKVFMEFVRHGTSGMTCQEAEANLGLKHQTCSARVNELAHAKCIQRTDRIRNGSYVYVVVDGATFDKFAEWQRAEKTNRKAPASVPSAVIDVQRISDPEQMVITRAKLYARTYWQNRPADELDAARNALLDAARFIEER